MMTSILLGILSSTAAEIVTALNKRLNGTVLQGDGAWLLALGVSLIGAAVKVFYIDHVPLSGTSYQALAPVFAEVWTVSQIYFLFVVQKLQLDVPSIPKKPASPALPQG